MGGTIRIRFAHDLWWTEINYENVIKWHGLEVTYLTNDTCFVDILDSNGGKTHVELYRKDYDKIINQKAFRLKFNLKKHSVI